MRAQPQLLARRRAADSKRQRERQKAAVAIQAAARGLVDRRCVAMMMAMLHETAMTTDEEGGDDADKTNDGKVEGAGELSEEAAEAACLRIQAMVRGAQERAWVEALVAEGREAVAAAVALQRWARGHAARMEGASELWLVRRLRSRGVRDDGEFTEDEEEEEEEEEEEDNEDEDQGEDDEEPFEAFEAGEYSAEVDLDKCRRTAVLAVL